MPFLRTNRIPFELGPALLALALPWLSPPSVVAQERHGQAKPKLASSESATAFAPTITYATAAQLAACIAGPGVTVSNAMLTGNPRAFATFSDPAGTVGFTSGVILSTGDAKSIVGPNTSDGITSLNGTAGDASLGAMVVGATHDAAILQFDFTCTSSTFGIDYVFASDEYNEFVGSPYNDSFAFFLDGTSPGNNIARVPATCTTPGGMVSVNTISCGYAASRGAPSGQGINCGCFRNNDIAGPGAPLGEMDGMTAVFHNTAAVGAGTHHMKIVIADVGDDAYDSNVLIGCGSLGAAPSSAAVDFSSSGVIAPGATLTLTPTLPATIELRDSSGTQQVALQSATFQVHCGASSGKDYDPMTITSASGAIGPCVVDGISIPGATFTLAGPAVGSINYDRGVFGVEMTVFATAPGYPTAKFFTYTSGQVLTPTTVRLFMGGGTVGLAMPPTVPALTGVGFVIAFGLILLTLRRNARRRERSQS